MKIKHDSEKKLDAIEHAVQDDQPVSDTLANDIEERPGRLFPPFVPPFALMGLQVPIRSLAKTVSIDVMSLYHRRFTTPGMSYPRPLKFVVESYVVAEGDTWESLAKKHDVTLEIMLRINGVKPEKVYAILDDDGKIPPELTLKVGQKIKVPVSEIRHKNTQEDTTL